MYFAVQEWCPDLRQWATVYQTADASRADRERRERLAAGGYREGENVPRVVVIRR